MPGTSQIQRGSGSGVILSEAGLIVTNHHVIDGADAIEVGLNDNRSFEAELVGSDPATDIAVLRIEANGLTALPWGNSDDVRIGDWVLAVGNPFDLTSTVTAGIVSAKARDIQLLRPDYARDVFPVESFIQTDAAVNPGNSGGALVDTRGQLVGINTAIASRTGSYAGYSFAVPANLAAKVARDLIEFGRVQRAFLGVTIRPVDEALAEETGLPGVEGVMVTGLTEDGGAAEAGLREGDVILSVDGSETPTLPLLLERVNRHRPGERTDIEVWRDGQTEPFTVELKDRFGRTELSAADETLRETLYGAVLEDAAEGGGVIVVESGTGALGRTGVPSGTRIQSVDGAPIDSTEDLMTAVEQAKKAGQKAVLIEGRTPDGQPAWFGMGIR
jgi:Do/DeqQ family serine protease